MESNKYNLNKPRRLIIISLAKLFEAKENFDLRFTSKRMSVNSMEEAAVIIIIHIIILLNILNLNFIRPKSGVPLCKYVDESF